MKREIVVKARRLVVAFGLFILLSPPDMIRADANASSAELSDLSSLAAAHTAAEHGTAIDESAPLATDHQDGDEQNAFRLAERLFLTAQFGGGPMASGGIGVALFDNHIRPEIQFGYTPSVEFEGMRYDGFSIGARMTARLLSLDLSEHLALEAGLGPNYAFYTGNMRVASSLFLAQAIDFREFLGLGTMSFFVEEHLYFLESEDSPYIFQLGLGLRFQLF